MKIEQIPIATLVPYLQNAKSHPQDQIDKLARAIQEFGFRIPVLIDDQNVLVAGHGRLLAAKQLGLKNIPAIRATGMTPEQCRAFRIADNKLGESEWLEDILRAEMLDMRDMELDMSLLGFDDLDFLIDPVEPVDAEPQIDQAEELNKKWKVVPGDLWKIGEHRLLCGDSTKAEDVARVMGGENAQLCFTSPPYGQQRDYDGDTKDKVSKWDDLMCGVFGNVPVTDDVQVLVNLGMIHRDGEWLPYWDKWIEWMRSNGWRRFGWYVWDQGFGLPGDWNGRLAPSHEFVFHFNHISLAPKKWVGKKTENIKARNKGESTMRGKDGKTKAFTNPAASSQITKVPDSVIRVGRQVGSNGHPAQFSVGLPSFMIQSWPGVVYDPFLGSGTTMVACENLNRKCRGIEISENYCAVILERMHQAFPGLTIRKVEKNP